MSSAVDRTITQPRIRSYSCLATRRSHTSGHQLDAQSSLLCGFAFGASLRSGLVLSTMVGVDERLRARWLARASQRVADAGHRTGAARRAVIELLARDGQCLIDAQQIIAELRPRRSPASVYRILHELLTLGLINRFDGRDGIARYEIVDPDHHHHHFVDEQTGDVHPFTDARLDAAVRETAERLGITISHHEVTLRGREQSQSRLLPQQWRRDPQIIVVPA